MAGLAELHPLPLGLVVLLLGACIGSFLNVVVHRLPRGESLVRPRSRCPGCGAFIAARDNVPVLSWLLLRGRCRQCRVAISPRYPLVEMATAVVFTGLYALKLETGLDLRLVFDWTLASALIAVALIDAEHQIIPNEITYPGIPLGLVVAGLVPPPSLLDAGLGLVIPAGMMWALAAFYERWRGRLGLGMGDVKLVAMLGAFLGLQPALGIMVTGSLLGLGWAVFLMLFRGADRQTRIAFGPALAAAGLLELFVPGLLQRALSLVVSA